MRHKQGVERTTVIGAGLAGSEAAWQIAQQGFPVDLFEMRPVRNTQAHKTDKCAELVCSNSFGSDSENSASRVLKDELTVLNSLILSCARKAEVPAGAALAVDREQFSGLVTEKIENHPLIQKHQEEVHQIDSAQITIIATGPLTSPSLAECLSQVIGQESLYFYDAISPIVSLESLDLDQMFYANRYDKGDTKDYLNIPLNREQYYQFIEDLLSAEVVLPHNFEEEKYFESCMPIEALAARGPKTLSFGPMKPVGLTDPKTGRWPHAAIQLRTENIHHTSFNLVGCQTKMKYPDQIRVFRSLPGMENVEFLRMGSMHRNTFINSPSSLSPTMQLRKQSNTYIAGQLTGTEGYLESSATGLVAGLNVARRLSGKEPALFPGFTMLGALIDYITEPSRKNFQPSNVNMGILPPLEIPVRKNKKLRNEQLSQRSQLSMQKWDLENRI